MPCPKPFMRSVLLGLPEAGTGVVIAERNQLSIGGDILNDTALEAAQIVTTRVHEVHARHEYAVEAFVKPAGRPSLRLVLPPFDAAQHTLERESVRSLAFIETLR